MNTGVPQVRATLAVASLLCVAHVAVWRSSRVAVESPAVTPARVQLRLDPNRATAAELELLPRIGPKLAQAIIAYRDASVKKPAFAAAEDLDGVPRIGPATVELLRPYLSFPDADAAALAGQFAP
jgi:competence ComEA-like helix-hairpin-helix protein